MRLVDGARAAHNGGEPGLLKLSGLGQVRHHVGGIVSGELLGERLGFAVGLRLQSGRTRPDARDNVGFGRYGAHVGEDLIAAKLSKAIEESLRIVFRNATHVPREATLSADDVGRRAAVHGTHVDRRERGLERHPGRRPSGILASHVLEEGNQAGGRHDGAHAAVGLTRMRLVPGHHRFESGQRLVGVDDAHGGWLADQHGTRARQLGCDSLDHARRPQATYLFVVGKGEMNGPL